MCATLALIGALAGPKAAYCASCLISTVTATGPAFGVYPPLAASPTYANGSVAVTCTIATAITATTTAVVSLSSGSSGSFALRTMLSGASPLNYNLYVDSAYTQVWGDGTGGSSTLLDRFSFILTGGLIQTVTSGVYGRIPALQLGVVPGSYTDTINVTVTY